jgi:tripartite-type tricarboxylate transporter receptor subunit TctC
VPTFAQAGLPGFDIGLWFGQPARGHARSRPSTAQRRDRKILAMPEFRESFAQGLEVFASTPEQYGAMLNAESEKFARIVKAAGITPE